MACQSGEETTEAPAESEERGTSGIPGRSTKRPLAAKKRRISKEDVDSVELAILERVSSSMEKRAQAAPPAEEDDDDIIFVKFLARELRKIKDEKIRSFLKSLFHTQVLQARFEHHSECCGLFPVGWCGSFSCCHQVRTARPSRHHTCCCVYAPQSERVRASL